MSKSAARADVNTVEDTIWKDTVKKELRAASEWEKEHDYLLPKERSTLLHRVQHELAQEGNSVSKDPRQHFLGRKPSQMKVADPKPFMDELALVPEPPQRNSAKVMDKYLFRQDPNRDLSRTDNVILRKRSMQNYYGGIPRAPHEVVDTADTGHARAESESESDRILDRLRRTSGLTSGPNHTTRSTYTEKINSPSNSSDTKAHSSTTEKISVRNDDLEDGDQVDRQMEQTISDYRLISRQRKAPPRIQSLEIFGVAQHGLKRAIFD